MPTGDPPDNIFHPTCPSCGAPWSEEMSAIHETDKKAHEGPYEVKCSNCGEVNNFQMFDAFDPRLFAPEQ